MSSGFTPCIYGIYAIDLIQYNKFDIIYKTFVRMYVRREYQPCRHPQLSYL